tara:strand:- start:68 stop:307 length:240 start_codon:yes stop_codon:yes gene_type:complete
MGGDDSAGTCRVPTTRRRSINAADLVVIHIPSLVLVAAVNANPVLQLVLLLIITTSSSVSCLLLVVVGHIRVFFVAVVR